MTEEEEGEEEGGEGGRRKKWRREGGILHKDEEGYDVIGEGEDVKVECKSSCLSDITQGSMAFFSQWENRLCTHWAGISKSHNTTTYANTHNYVYVMSSLIYTLCERTCTIYMHNSIYTRTCVQ